MCALNEMDIIFYFFRQINSTLFEVVQGMTEQLMYCKQILLWLKAHWSTWAYTVTVFSTK